MRLIISESQIRCPVTQEITDEVKQFPTSEALLRAGGISTDALDRAAFGFAASDVTQLTPKEIKIKWKDDYEGVKWEIARSGKSPRKWASGVDLGSPVEVSYEGGKFVLEDGHHRWWAAKILNKTLPVELEIKDSAIAKLMPHGDYESYHRCIFNQIHENNS